MGSVCLGYQQAPVTLASHSLRLRLIEDLARCCWPRSHNYLYISVCIMRSSCDIVRSWLGVGTFVPARMGAAKVVSCTIKQVLLPQTGDLIGGLIKAAMDRVSRAGVVTMEEYRTAEDHLYVEEGMQSTATTSFAGSARPSAYVA